MKKIIAFAGSNSSDSINKKLVAAASKLINNTDVELLDLKDFSAPIYGIDEENSNGFPESMVQLHEKMQQADGFIVSSPEHNGSMPAVLKNTIDWQSRIGRKVFNDKPTVFLSTSPGPRGGLSALTHLLNIMPYQGAAVVGGHSVGDFFNKVKEGELVEGEDRDSIAQLIKKLESAVSA